MSDYGDYSVDIAGDVTDFGMGLSPLGGGDDVEYDYDNADDTDDEDDGGAGGDYVDGSAVMAQQPAGKKRHVKKPRARFAKPATNGVGAAVQLAAIAIDALSAPGTAPLPQHCGPIRTGMWSTGVCNCAEYCVPNCLMATFCPCVTAAQISTRLGVKYQTALLTFGLLVILECVAYGLTVATINTTEYRDNSYYSYYSRRYVYSTYTVTYNRLSIWGYIAIVLSILVFFAFWQLRSQVRERFQLPGTCFQDCFVSFCCTCCSLTQMATHVQSYKPHSCDFGAPDELPAYST